LAGGPLPLFTGLVQVLPSSELRRYLRRVVIAVVVVAQLTMIVVAYESDHKTFGFQMFPESSRWQADIVRVQADGTRVPVNEGWEYRWSDLVRDRGLENPFVDHHADSGLRNQFGYFQGALDWVAEHTPNDSTTAYLEADVTYTDNGRGPYVRTFRSVDRTDVVSP
jgi:hypothetical protein